MTLTRRTPLRSKTALKRGGPLRRLTALPRESVKRRRSAPARRRLVAEMLEAFPICCRCQWRAAVTLHEPLKRSRRPGSHLDPSMTVPSCSPCNSFADEHPADAEAEGWLIPSSWPYDSAVAVCDGWRTRGRAA